MLKTICFFAKVPDRKLLDYVQWYKNDITILQDMCQDLVISTNLKEIKTRCDLYFSWFASGSIYPLIVAKIFSKPIIVIAGGSEVLKSRSDIPGFHSKSFLGRISVRMVLKFADEVIAVSHELKKEVRMFNRQKVQVVYHGIDTDLYRPETGDKDIIFSISYLDRANMIRKKLMTFVNAIPIVLEKYPDQKFVLAGTKGDAYEVLIKQAKALNIESNLIFPGQISNEEKLKYFARSKVYVQPTIHEGFGVAIAEAMSCGIPVISSYNSAVKEVLGDAGIYTDPDNHAKLAEDIIKILDGDDNYIQLGKMGRNRILQKFTLKSRKEALNEILNRIMNKS